MTLGKKKKGKSAKSLKQPGMALMKDGLHDMSKPGHPLVARYPLFLGTENIRGVSVDYPVKIEFVKEGKFYFIIFYDPKLGMIAKSRIPTAHANYLIAERIAKNKATTKKEIENILRYSRTKHYNR